MDFGTFWKRFVLGRMPDHRYGAATTSVPGQVKAWKPR